VDLASTAGGAVMAAGAGVVAYAGSVAGRDVVSIDHPDGIRTTYEPVSAVVRAGQRIAAGQLIGRLQRGHPSCSPSTCLHWGARLPDGSYLDPMGLLAGLKVRLLPWT
jgi:murein DD-endopeptidase MepM/ murein hydrolase activator NlpD